MQHADLLHGAHPGCLLAEQLINDSGIGALMPALIRSNGTSDLPEDLVTIILGMSCSGAMRDLGGALLEGCVDESQVWVVFGLWVHAAANQVLDGNFHGLHVDSAREHTVLVHQVAVSVLLCGPLTSPPVPQNLVCDVATYSSRVLEMCANNEIEDFGWQRQICLQLQQAQVVRWSTG